MPAVPKPRPAQKSPRRPLKKSGRIKPKKRTAGEFKRIYGSRARVEFVKSLPCIACGLVGYSDNAHIENGGKSRKADYTKIVPLCGVSQLALVGGWRQGFRGHHDMLDNRLGREGFERTYGLNLDECAAAVERRWQAFSKEGE